MPSDDLLWDSRFRRLNKILADELERLFPNDDALAKKIQELYELYEFGPIGYLKLAKNGRIRSVNLAAAILLRSPRAELIGQSLNG